MILKLGEPYYVGALFLDSNKQGVTGLSPIVHIRLASNTTWWDGDSLEVAPTNLAMTEVNATNAPGEYIYTFIPDTAGQYFGTCFEAAGGVYGGVVVEPIQPFEVLFEPTWVADIDVIRKVQRNRIVVNAAGTVVMVYEDDAITPAFSFSVSADRLERNPT